MSESVALSLEDFHLSRPSISEPFACSFAQCLRRSRCQSLHTYYTLSLEIQSSFKANVGSVALEAKKRCSITQISACWRCSSSA